MYSKGPLINIIPKQNNSLFLKIDELVFTSNIYTNQDPGLITGKRISYPLQSSIYEIEYFKVETMCLKTFLPTKIIRL